MFRTRFKTSLIGLSISLVLMALLAINGIGTAFATDPCKGIPDCISITAGTLTAPIQSLTFSTDQFTLNGTDWSTTIVSATSGGPLIQVIDATGSGAGWNVQASSTSFTYSHNSSTFTLANASITIDWTSAGNSATNIVSCGTNSTCTVPSDSAAHGTAATPTHLCALTSTTSVDAPNLTPFKLTSTNQLLCNAAAGTGMGTINLDPKMTVNLPANVSSTAATLNGTDAFTATISVTSTSGPQP